MRDDVGLTGSKEGCDDSECGACMMLIDGRPVNSCSYLAVQADGAEITTVEGLADGDHLVDAAADVPRGAAASSAASARRACSSRPRPCSATTPHPTEDEIRIGLSGNLCRCTGYDGIIAAVAQAAREG